MEPEADGSSAEPSTGTTPARKLPSSARVLLWIFLGAWVISFFLPAARIDGWDRGRKAHGWELVETSLVLLFVPVKGTWLDFYPHIWLVWINLFMLLAPLEIKRAERGQGRVYAVIFSVVAAIPVTLAYIPYYPGVVGLAWPLLPGFCLWEFSLIATAALFVRTIWPSRMATLPATCLTGLLFALPVYRSEVDFLPSLRELGQKSGPVGASQARFTAIKLVASSPNPSLSGNPVSWTATISAPDGSVPKGTVALVDGAALIGRVYSATGVATFSTTALKAGSHFITAKFSGDVTSNYLGSASPGITQIVNDPNDTATRTVLALVEQHPVPGADLVKVTVKATVTAIGSTTPVTSGEVTLMFMYGDRIPLRLDDQGEAVLSRVLPAAVSRGYEIEATYGGGGGFQASASTLTLP